MYQLGTTSFQIAATILEMHTTHHVAETSTNILLSSELFTLSNSYASVQSVTEFLLTLPVIFPLLFLS